MNSVITRKRIQDDKMLAGSPWGYEYLCIPETYSDEEIKKYVAWVQKQAAPLTSTWNDELNSEWLVRMFMAARMVLGASLMANSCEYAEENNLRVTIPYLQYYSILYSLKCLVLTLPNVKWNEGEIIKQTHTKTINLACDALAQLNKNSAAETETQIFHAKAVREFISYRAPSSGDSVRQKNWDPFITCSILLELAQLTSEVFEKSLLKRIDDKQYRVLEKYTEEVCKVQMNEVEFFDEEDSYRIGYFVRKYPLPTNICFMMTEGHVEDFFGAWCPDNELEDGMFNPDADWRILFQVP